MPKPSSAHDSVSDIAVQDKTQMLFNAIKTFDFPGIQTAIQENVDLEASDPTHKNYTVIQLAALTNDEEIFTLVFTECDKKGVSYNPYELLVFCCSHNAHLVARYLCICVHTALLLEKQLESNECKPLEDALYSAIQYNHFELAVYLMRCIQLITGKTALSTSALYRKADVVHHYGLNKVFKSFGSSLGATIDEPSLFDLCLYHQNPEMLEALLAVTDGNPLRVKMAINLALGYKLASTLPDDFSQERFDACRELLIGFKVGNTSYAGSYIESTARELTLNQVPTPNKIGIYPCERLNYALREKLEVLLSTWEYERATVTACHRDNRLKTEIRLSGNRKIQFDLVFDNLIVDLNYWEWINQDVINEIAKQWEVLAREFMDGDECQSLQHPQPERLATLSAQWESMWGRNQEPCQCTYNGITSTYKGKGDAQKLVGVSTERHIKFPFSLWRLFTFSPNSMRGRCIFWGILIPQLVVGCMSFPTWGLFWAANIASVVLPWIIFAGLPVLADVCSDRKGKAVYALKTPAAKLSESQGTVLASPHSREPEASNATTQGADHSNVPPPVAVPVY